MTRWTLFVLGGCLVFAGCTLDTAGLATSPPKNQAMGGSGGAGGAGQGGAGQGGAGQGGGPECGAAYDCPSAASACGVAACENGVCVEVPGNKGFSCRGAASDCDVAEVCDGTNAQCPPDVLAAAGMPCRPVTGSCDAAEVCDGVNAACVPDTGPAAACTPKLPITYMNLERTFTITSVNLAGTGQTVATVSPGAQVSLQVGGSWQRMASPSCPGCVTQFYASINQVFQGCMDASGGNGMINLNNTFTAPSTPGVYIINPTATWEFKCVDVTVPTTFSATSIATLVVQ